MDSMETVKILKALADANRLHILELLGSGEQIGRASCRERV